LPFQARVADETVSDPCGARDGVDSTPHTRPACNSMHGQRAIPCTACLQFHARPACNSMHGQRAIPYPACVLGTVVPQDSIRCWAELQPVVVAIEK